MTERRRNKTFYIPSIFGVVKLNVVCNQRARVRSKATDVLPFIRIVGVGPDVACAHSLGSGAVRKCTEQ